MEHFYIAFWCISILHLTEDSSLKETLDDKLESFTFTKGYAYCSLLFDECYFDKDAMDEIISHYKK